MHLKVPIILLTYLGFSLAATVSYESYKVYKVTPKTEKESHLLRSLESNSNFDFWSKINRVRNPVSVMVAPESQKNFENVLKTNKLEYEILIENVKNTIHAEKDYHRARKVSKSGRITFDQYLQHDEINNYLDQLAEDYPETVSVESIGQSYEGRDMKVIRISTGPRNPRPKPIIFIDAGIHAREWIAPAVALYLINQLVENPDNSDLIADADWIILPSVNPDGYEFTWTSDRMWRKTVSPGILCNGCDANRNFGFHWMESGASNWECSETYAGKKAFSEVETQNLRDFLNKTQHIAAYLTLHSYGQYLLYPWGYVDVLADNWEELDQLGHDMDAAISAVRGTTYTIGGSTATLYAAAGASDDWAMGVRGISIVYTMELPGGGIYGFDLPAEEIQGVVEETFEGLKVFGNYVAQNRK